MSYMYYDETVIFVCLINSYHNKQKFLERNYIPLTE